jgi:hypothetical protein
VSLRRAQIGGDLDCTSAAFDRVGDAAWGNGTSLVLDRAQIGGTLRLGQLAAPLLGASFAGTHAKALVDDLSTWGERLVLDGFAYSNFGDGAPLDASFRLAWLEHQPSSHIAQDFRMQPWRRAIRVLRRMGHGASASELAVRREQRLRRIGRIGQAVPGALRWAARGAHALFGALVGYGWRPQRLVLWALLVWLAGAAFFGQAQQEGALVPAGAPALMPFSPLAYTLDLMLPLVDLHEKRHWMPAAGAALGFGWSDIARLAGWAVTLFGWAVGTLLLVSVAGWADRDRER